MAEYDPADVRAVLREHGYTVSDRGRISGEHIEEYERIVNRPADSPDGEYDAGISAADFPDDDEPIPAPVPERKPRKVRQSRPGPGIMQRLQGGGKGKGKAKRKHPRIPVDRLTGRVYEALGRIVTPAMPPVGRAMTWQSPVVGLVFEDMVRDTVADRALQPIARAEAVAEKGAAILGLPLVVGALTAAQGLPEDQRMVREAFLVPMLRELVIMNIKIMGDKAEEMAERQAEQGPLNDRANEIMGMFFAAQTVTAEQEPSDQMAGV